MIYIKTEKEPENFKELLLMFFSLELTSDRISTVTSYFDKECTKEQCQENKMRSFDDILELAQTYFPEITPKEVFHELITLDMKSTNGRKYFPHLGCCGTM